MPRRVPQRPFAGREPGSTRRTVADTTIVISRSWCVAPAHRAATDVCPPLAFSRVVNSNDRPMSPRPGQPGLRTGSSDRAKALVANPPAVILYALPADVAAECERVATELRLARAEVKHLQAACSALQAHSQAMLVAGTSIRSWDREVVEEHAARHGVPLRWVEADHTPHDVSSELRTWASDTLRRARR